MTDNRNSNNRRYSSSDPYRSSSAGRRPAGSSPSGRTSASAGRTSAGSAGRYGASSDRSASGSTYSSGRTRAYSRRETATDYEDTVTTSRATRPSAGSSARRGSASAASSGSSRRPSGGNGGNGGNGGSNYRNEIKKRNKTYTYVMIACIVVAALVLTIGIMLYLSRETKILGTPDKSASASAGNKGGGSSQTVVADATATPEPTATPTPTPAVVKIAAVGDDLIHTGVYKSGIQADGSLNYDHLFDDVMPYISDCDLKCINQETVMAGGAFSSYPSFNSPTEIGDAIVKAGFNVVTQATNHAFDMGQSGLINDAKFWKENYPYETSGVLVTGIYETAEEQQADHIRVIEVNGIKFAIMNYTYSHNWTSFSTGAEGHLDMLCAYDATSREIDFDTINPAVIEDIKAAEDMADFTIVFPHWGTEYVAKYTDQQSNFAKQMTEAGCDLIIGTHPHVIEPVEWVTSDNGNKCLVYYSLGNFTSTQDAIERIVGGLAMVNIIKDVNGTYIDEASIKAVPIITHYNSNGWQVTGNYLLKDYTDDKAASHGLLARVGTKVTYDKLYKIASDAFGDYLCLDPTADTSAADAADTTDAADTADAADAA